MAVILGVIGSVYGFKNYVDGLVNKKLESSETIDKISRLIRPSLIFDNKGVILADLGAMEHIKSINLGYNEGREPTLPTRIEVTFKKFLALPPLLTSLDSYSYNEKVNRGQGLSWIFELEPLSYTSDIGYFRFRVEVLR
jgi:hypothetical protein